MRTGVLCHVAAIVAAVVLTVSGGASAQEDVVLHLKFDEGKGAVARDSGGHGNKGTIKGAEWVRLVKGYALRFDGVTSQVEVPNSPSLALGDSSFTIELWIRPDDLSQTMDLMSKWGKEEFLVHCGGGHGDKVVMFLTDWNCYRYSQKAALKVGQWAHVVFVKTNEEGKADVAVYVDGVNVTGTGTGPQRGGGLDYPVEIKSKANSLYIGGLTGYGFFKGLIAEARIVKRALSAEEVKAAFERVAPGDLEPAPEARPDAALPPATPVFPIANLVKNPGFEEADPDHPDRPAGFAPGSVAGAGRNPRMTWEEPGFSGRKAVAVETMHSNDLGYWETTVPVRPNSEYLIAFQYKCATAGRRAATAGDPEFNRGGVGGPNLELGIVPDDAADLAAPASWTDIGLALGPLGGVYLPVATDWTSWRQRVRTADDQTRLKIKLRLWCYAQKVWFDDLSVVEAASVPKADLLAPAPDAVIEDGRPELRWSAAPEITGSFLVECSRAPGFTRNVTQQFTVTGTAFRPPAALTPGPWYWRVGALDRFGVPFWFGERRFEARTRAWTAQDTTPPAVHSPAPLPNASADPTCEIAAAFGDSGSGIDPASVRLLLDGGDVAAQAQASAAGVRFRPAQPLAAGPHTVELSVADKAGNRSNVLVWRFGVGARLSHDVRVDGRTVLLNGRPFFPIGIYSYVCHPGDGRFNESLLRQAAQAGFNMVLNTVETEAGLDRLFQNGIMGALNATYDMTKIGDTPESIRAALFEKGQGRFCDHPAAVVFWADDAENLDNTDGTPLPDATRMKLENSRRILKEIAPHRPMVYAISNLPRLAAAMPYGDICLSYRYPVPTYHPQMLYGWTLAYVGSVVKDKPIWFNSQAYDLGYGGRLGSRDPRPTPEEVRAMAFYSLVWEVRGWTAYTAQVISEDTPPGLWAALRRVASEMRYLAPALAAAGPSKEAALDMEASPAGSIHFREIEQEGKCVLIAVNMSGGPVAASWRFTRPVRVAALFEDRVMPGPAAEVFDHFGPFETHVYQWQGRIGP